MLYKYAYYQLFITSRSVLILLYANILQEASLGYF